MICANCGAEIPDDSSLCPICASDPIATVSATVAEPAPAQNAANQATINYSKLSKAQYKDAKAAYKAARKAAGKSRAPLVVTCIILALVLAAGGAFAMWWYLNPKIENLTTENADFKTQVEKLTAENKELTQKLAEYENGNATPSNNTGNPLIGAWKVDSFDSTTEHFACFGGKAKQASVRINIKEIDEAKGTIKADLAVVYHAHDRSKLKADTDSSPDDVVLEFADAEGVFADDAFTFELAVDSKFGNNSGIVVSGLMTTADANTSMFGTQTAGTSTFQLSVKSYYQSLTNAITDTYLMKN